MEALQEISDSSPMLRTLVKAIALLGLEIRWEDVIEEASEELAQGELRSFAQNLHDRGTYMPASLDTCQGYRETGNGSDLRTSGIAVSPNPLLEELSPRTSPLYTNGGYIFKKLC